MTKIVKGILLYSFLCCAITVSAQRPVIKFGDVQPKDFAQIVYNIDSSASAVILYDVASSKYEGDNNGGFQIIFKRHTRIRLLNRTSFDLATVSIPLYASGTFEEKIESLEASTYNVENGKVETYKLDKGSIFKDKLNKNFAVRKFTMPNLKEGSIIEIKYTLNSPYERNLRSWSFQGEHPVLWSEYQVTIPSVYEFITVNQGYNPYVVDESNNGRETYNIASHGTASERTSFISFPTTTYGHIWAIKNIPALKKENFITTLDNHISRIKFQLAKIKFPGADVKEVMTNWRTVSEDLMKDPDFGETLTKNNVWLRDELKPITAGASTTLEVARKIFEYIRDHVSCNDNSAKWLSNPLKKIYQSRNGSVADINMLLAASLINNGFEAHPVLLSTRDHGKITPEYPVLDQMNYVVTELVLDGKSYLLDASHSKLGFGKLSHECYNDYGRVIDNANPHLVSLSADSLVENKVTNVFIINDSTGGLSGRVISNLGDYESMKVRERLAGTTKEDYFKELKKEFSFDVNLSNWRL
jgi:hypothetical protein